MKWWLTLSSVEAKPLLKTIWRSLLLLSTRSSLLLGEFQFHSLNFTIKWIISLGKRRSPDLAEGEDNREWHSHCRIRTETSLVNIDTDNQLKPSLVIIEKQVGLAHHTHYTWYLSNIKIQNYKQFKFKIIYYTVIQTFQR